MYINTQWISENLFWIIASEAVAVAVYYYISYRRSKSRNNRIDFSNKNK